MEDHLSTEELELRAAELLGRMLFAFSRLEVALGLYIVWSDNGKDLDDRTQFFNASTTHAKLTLFEQLYATKYAEATEARAVFEQWSREMNDVRHLRNALVHGRWGIIESSQEVANVVRLPTSPDQREVRYSLTDLADAVSRIAALEQRLHTLRKTWPL